MFLSLSVCQNNIEEIILYFFVYLKYNSLNVSEQEVFNIKVIEKQETHFMSMHIFHKSKLFHIITRR